VLAIDDGNVYASAMNHYARGLALTAKGQPREAEAEYAALTGIVEGEGSKAHADGFPQRSA